jgi:hypothetical protein
VSLAAASLVGAAARRRTLSLPPVGLNTDFHTYFGSDFPAKNAMWRAPDWGPVNATTLVATASSINSFARDLDGYPTSLPQTIDGTSQCVAVLVFGGATLPSPYYPAGAYRIYFDGVGTLRVRGDSGTVNVSTSGTLIQVNTPSTGGLNVAILTSTLGNHVRNIRLLPPGETPETYAANPWSTHYASLISGFGIHRFMNWQCTNQHETVNGTTTWASRPRASYFTQQAPPIGTGIRRGMAIEWIVDFCNRFLVNPWLCIPHGATDDYVTGLAQYLYDNLDPRLVIRPERSNEVWNSLFRCSVYFADLGIAQGLNLVGRFTGANTADPSVRFWASIKALAKRQGRDNYLFDQVFGSGGSSRWVRGIGSFVANATLSSVLFDSYYDVAINPHEAVSGIELQKVYIAPYWGVRTTNLLTDRRFAGTAYTDAAINADYITDAYTETNGWVASHQTWANPLGIDVECYEFGYGAAPNDARIATLIPGTDSAAVAARAALRADVLATQLRFRRHEDSYAANMECHRALTDRGVTAACHLGFIFPPSFSGCWGSLESEYMAGADTYPTWRALRDYTLTA